MYGLKTRGNVFRFSGETKGFLFTIASRVTLGSIQVLALWCPGLKVDYSYLMGRQGCEELFFHPSIRRHGMLLSEQVDSHFLPLHLNLTAVFIIRPLRLLQEY